MAEQYLRCPNCGANATNHLNCEYCGSLLVRFVEKGIDLSKTTYMTNEGVFPGLAEELRRNLKIQRNNPDVVATDIYFNKVGSTSDYDAIGVLRTGMALWQDGSRIDSYGKTDGFVIVFNFNYDPNNPTVEDRIVEFERHLRFKELDCFQLFTELHLFSDDGVLEMFEYALDFGSDPEGAARLISEIIQKVYLVPLSEKIDIQTGVGVENVKRMRDQYRIKRGLKPFYDNDDNDDNDDDDDGEWSWWYYVAGAIILFALAKCAF